MENLIVLKSSVTIEVQDDHRSCWNHQLRFAKVKSWLLLLEIKQFYKGTGTFSGSMAIKIWLVCPLICSDPDSVNRVDIVSCLHKWNKLSGDWWSKHYCQLYYHFFHLYFSHHYWGFLHEPDYEILSLTFLWHVLNNQNKHAHTKPKQTQQVHVSFLLISITNPGCCT